MAKLPLLIIAPYPNIKPAIVDSGYYETGHDGMTLLNNGCKVWFAHLAII